MLKKQTNNKVNNLPLTLSGFEILNDATLIKQNHYQNFVKECMTIYVIDGENKYLQSSLKIIMCNS